ncbi:unnamed protein product [Paramecium primaurelia]|uniref:NADH dehydrogenase [ubiquinone] 1 beta subcomplex subunit 7 n=1 Tax=Paramecium primaurelia TaxID=5886 RepID=A0A8S1MQJ0_PARPR|nr:unnamed protein product [Paramecium primaurelia]
MSHHHQKYYERPDGYVYTPEELDAHRIPLPFRDRCVNFYVPFFKCQQIKTDNLFKTTLQAIDQTLDHWGGECYKEKRDYLNCAKTAYQYSLAVPVQNIYTANPWYASQEAVSSELEKNHFNSPVLY